MKRVIRFLIGAAMLTTAAYPQSTTIGDLPNASSVTATDDFACDQGATTRACTALQIKNLLVTYFDTEEELEALLSDVTDLLTEASTLGDLAETDIGIESGGELLIYDGVDSWDNIALSGDVAVIADGTTTVNDDAIGPDAVESAAQTDEYCLTYESDDDGWEWQVCGGGGGGATSEQDLEDDLADTANVLTDNDASITFDAGINLITTANGDIDLSPNGTGEVNVNSALNTGTTATPTISFKDDDSVKDPPDDNATISANLTDPGDGSEDADLSVKIQIAGALTEVMAFDADGNISTSNLIFAPSGLDLPAQSVLEADLYATDAAADGECLSYDGVGAGDFEWVACGSGGGAWSDASDPVVLNTTTKDVAIGTAQKNSSKLTVDGEGDVIQVTFQGHSTQTTNTEILLVEKSDGTDLFSVNDDSTVVVGGSTSTITGTGTYVEIDDVLYITPAATPPIACTTNAGIIYHDTSGVICICDGSSSWVEVVDYTGTGACS